PAKDCPDMAHGCPGLPVQAAGRVMVRNTASSRPRSTTISSIGQPCSRPSRRMSSRIGRPSRAILDDILRLGREQGWPMEEMVVERGRLDEVFRTITRPAA
ncbi:MAG: hypothetical protein K8F57_05690, partial [Alphaproteobacteria bacterium]|nr:hypothetical protein [Alphaproteobacteria bacterium]